METAAVGVSITTVSISLGGEWSIRSPRPHALEQPLPLRVRPDGKFYKAAQAQQASGVKKGWWASPAFRKVCEGLKATPTLLDTMIAFANVVVARPFYLQLLWWVGGRLQSAISKSLAGDGKFPHMKARRTQWRTASTSPM